MHSAKISLSRSGDGATENKDTGNESSQSHFPAILREKIFLIQLNRERISTKYD